MLKFGLRWSATSLLCLALAGCLATGAGGGAGASNVAAVETVPADARLTTGEGASFFSNSGWQSCMVAGGGTAVLCMALGEKPAKCLAGALAVCGVAMGANYYLEQRRSEHSSTTKRLNAMTDDVKADTERVAMRAETMRGVIGDDKKRMAALQKTIKANKVDTEAARTELAQIDKNLEIMRKELGVMKTKSTNYQEALAKEGADNKLKKADVAKMDGEIQKLNKQVAMLEKEIDSVYTQRSAITLG
ncbi:hypothetical protein [Comamonas sp.]|uniref:hypothetical protein n=1 Tax=Comamonas sp. TaxID=34028 RepID=UPI00289A59E0|nr:hypothetical protein [Comamonas sp.]